MNDPAQLRVPGLPGSPFPIRHLSELELSAIRRVLTRFGPRPYVRLPFVRSTHLTRRPLPPKTDGDEWRILRVFVTSDGIPYKAEWE